MKRNFALALMFLAAAGFASAQIYTPTQDILGAHLVGGRGCVACHTPHSGAFGNGQTPSKDVANTGSVALWGEDLSNILGHTLNTGGGTYVDALPSSVTAGTADVMGVMLCLSCHDGSVATPAMMQGHTYETLATQQGFTGNPPTLLGNDGTGTGNYLNDHPVGPSATIGCNSAANPESGYNWDCTITSAGLITPGPSMQAFIQNYGFFVSPAVVGGKPAVMCTTCHDQHSMNAVVVLAGATNRALSTGPKSGIPTGTYKSMFFVNGPYNPNTATSGSNQDAQFCRQCHGGESNEMHGGTVPTIF